MSHVILTVISLAHDDYNRLAIVVVSLRVVVSYSHNTVHQLLPILRNRAGVTGATPALSVWTSGVTSPSAVGGQLGWQTFSVG